MPQLKNASKHSGKFRVIALILGGSHVRLPQYLVLWPVHRAGSSGSVQEIADSSSAAMPGMLLWAKS